MADNIIRIFSAEHVDYLITNNAGEEVASGSAFHPDQLPQFPDGAQTSVIVPGENVLLLTTTLPKMARAQLLKALPFALEEQLIEPVEQLHFVAGKQNADGEVTVAVVNQQRLNDWLVHCQQLQLVPQRIIPDFLAIPYIENQWHIYLDGERALVRTNQQNGMAIERNQLAELLQLSLATAEPLPEQLNIDYDDGNEHFELDSLHELSVPSQLAEAHSFSMNLFQQGLTTSVELNLLQGVSNAYKPVSKTRRYWRWALGIFILWCVLWLGLNITQYFVYQHRLHQAQQKVATLYKQAFPQAQDIVSPKLRISRALAAQQSSGGGGDFLGLLTQVAQPIGQTKGKISVQNFTYHANGGLVLAVNADSFQSLANLVTVLRQKGLSVQQQNAASQGKQVTAKLTITGAANG